MKSVSRRLPSGVARWVLNGLAPFIAVGFGRAALSVVERGGGPRPRWLAFLAGAAVVLPLWGAARRFASAPAAYLSTLEHELTHVLVGLLFLKRPLSIRVTAREGGEVTLTGGNVWITLAPYYLPTLTVLLLPAGLLAPGRYQLPLLGALGATVAYHLISTWGEVRVMQSDFRKAGLLQTAWLLPVANLVTYGSIAAYVAGDYSGFADYWKAGAVNALTLVTETAGYLIGK